jgi:hypothetical protein
MAYGPSIPDLCRRAAVYVDKVRSATRRTRSVSVTMPTSFSPSTTGRHDPPLDHYPRRVLHRGIGCRGVDLR